MSAMTKLLGAFIGVLALGLLSPAPSTLAQTSSSVLPTGGGAALLDPSDTVFLLLDHQSGLFQTVKDIPVAELRSNVVMLAKLATLMKIPVITTASEPKGTNGPIMPEILQEAPHAVYVARKGEVNAWDNEDFVRTVKSTGKKTLIMAGVWTSVCVMFPALDAKLAGYKVYAVMDASGDISDMANRTALARFCSGRRYSNHNKCCAFRDASHLEQTRSGGDRRTLCPRLAKLCGGRRELQQGAGSRAQGWRSVGEIWGRGFGACLRRRYSRRRHSGVPS